MSPVHSRSFKIFWITLQMVFALIGSHPESAIAHFYPYVSEFQYHPQYHPSRNPDCTSQRWQRRKFYEEQFIEHNRVNNHPRSSFEKPLDQNHPWIEIRAVLVRCSKTRKQVKKMYKQPQRDCRRKVIISMKINNIGKTNTREEFVLVDHVLDPIKMRKIRLHNPYVIKFRQEALLHLYGLRFQSIVNAEATEEIINNHRVNFTGCNDGLDNPTCGLMLINGKPIPFSQGFCCSCEDAQHNESFHSVAVESSYCQRDDNPNRARNRSESTVNLFDNTKAQHQKVKTSGNEEERYRQIEPKKDEAREQITNRNNTFNDPFDKRVPSYTKYQDKKQFRNNSIRLSIPFFEEFRWTENDANGAKTLSPLLKSVLSDPSPSKQKIEAYINDVYEQATKERATKMKNDENKNLSIKNETLASFNNSKNKFQNRWINDDRSLIHGSRVIASDSRNPVVKLTKLRDELKEDFRNSRKDNRKFLLEKCDRSMNFPKSEKNPEKRTRDRSCDATGLENTFDYTPIFLAINSSRIPEESQFLTQTQRNVSTNNGNFVAKIEFFTLSGISLENDINENIINRDIASSTIKSNSFRKGKDMLELLSKIIISETSPRQPMKNGERFEISKNDVDSLNVERRKNSNAVAFQNDNARSEEMKNANVSTQISISSAFTTLQNLSSSSFYTAGISRLEELESASNVRPEDKSLTKIFESRTRSSLSANGIQNRFSDEFSNLYESRESRKIYSSPEPKTSKDVNLENNYKFWKPSRRKFRKWKDIETFRGDKNVNSKTGFKKFLSFRESINKNKHETSDFKCDSSIFPNGFSKREKCFQRRSRRHVQIENKDSNSAKRSENVSKDEDSQREVQTNIDHYVDRPEIVYSERKTSKNRGNKSPKKQVILESDRSYEKVRSGKDNPFFFDKERSNVDKRIEDKFARISNVLKENSAEVKIQEIPKNLKATKSKIARADISKIQNKLRDDSFLIRKSDQSDESFATDREATPEYSAHTRSIMNKNFLANAKFITTSNEITLISSSKDDSIDYKVFASLQSGEKLSDTILGPFLSSPIMRMSGRNVSKKVNFVESTSSIHTTNTMKPTESFKTSAIPKRGKNVNGYFTVAKYESFVDTLSDSYTNFEKTTMYPKASDNRRDEAENARFLELNNNFSRMIAGNFMGSRDPASPFDEANLLLRISGSSIIEPTSKTSTMRSDEKGEKNYSHYNRDPFRENSIDMTKSIEEDSRTERSREFREIADVMDRIVRQYVAYTPIMPGMPTFDEITEAETLPLEDETTMTVATTLMATTTRITDAGFQLSTFRPLKTTMFLREMHDEIALEKITFVDETEATTTSQETTISKRQFRIKVSDANFAPEEKLRRVSSKIEKDEERRKIVDASVNMTSVERETDEHPWYRTTEMQRMIVANGYEPVQKIGPVEKQRYKSGSDYFSNDVSSTTIIFSSVALARTRDEKLDIIRESNDREHPLIFYDYEEEDNEDYEQNERTRRALSKDKKFLDTTTESNKLYRSRIEKGLAGKSNDPANRKSFRQNYENRDQTQKHNAASRDIATMSDMKLEVNHRDDLDSNAQEKKRNAQDSLKNVIAFSKLRRAKDDGANDRFVENVTSRDRETLSASRKILFSTKIPTSRKNLSGSMHKKKGPKMDRQTAIEKRAQTTVKIIDEIDVTTSRKIVASLNSLKNVRTSANVDDSSKHDVESRRESAMDEMSTDSGDKNSQTDTAVRSAKLMMANNKNETLDVVAVKNIDKKIPLTFYRAKQWKQFKDARKINENRAKNPRVHHHVFVEKEYFPRPRHEVHDVVRKTIDKKIVRKKLDEKNIAGNEKRADRSLTDVHWHRSGRRLLSSSATKSGYYIENVEDEYYEDDESETTDGENDSMSNYEAIAKRDDLSDLENRSILRDDRDSRKLLQPETRDRLADENTDVARTVMPKERTVADSEMVSDVQEVSEEAISRSNEKKVMDKNADLDEKPDIEVELADSASFNDDKKKKFNKSENTLRNFQIYEKIDEEPLSFFEKINEDDIRDESLHETQPASMSDAKKITINRNLSNVGKIRQNIDENPIKSSKTEESVKISLTGRIQVNDGFNQTPVLISFDTIPENRSSATQSSISTKLSNSIGIIQAVIETTVVNLPDSNTRSTYDLSSIIEHTNDEASDSLNVIADENCEAGKTNTENKVAIKSRDKFFDLTRGNKKKKRKTTKTDSRIEKRLDKYSANSRTAKQVFLTDHTKSSIAPSDRTNKIARTIKSKQTINKAVDRSDPRVSASVVRFPNILGSVLVDKDDLKHHRDQAIKESPCRRIVNVSSSNTTNYLRVVPLLRVRIEKPSVDSTNDERRDGITHCPDKDSRNITSDSCYRIPTIVRKLEFPKTIVRDKVQIPTDYRDSDSTIQTFSPDIREPTTIDQNEEGTARSISSSTRQFKDDVFQTTEYATNDKTFRDIETSCDRHNNKSINAIRLRNMMAIVRFMMKLLKIVADEKPACLRRTPIGETIIRVKNVIVDSENNVKKSKSADMRTTTISEREKQNFTIVDEQFRKSTEIAERTPDESLPLNVFDTFEASTLPSISDETFVNEESSAFFQTSTKVYYPSPTSSTLPSTTLLLFATSFLFYELERPKTLLREDASQKNITVLRLMDVKQNSSVSFNDLQKDSKAKKSRLDDSQNNRSRRRNQDRSFADRFHFDKQEIASTKNFKKNKIAPKSLRKSYSTRDTNVGFRSSKSIGIANDKRPKRVSRDTLDAIDNVRENRFVRLKKKPKKVEISDQHDTKTKLINSFNEKGRSSPRDWVGKHRAIAVTRRSPIDKKLGKLRKVNQKIGIAMPKKVVPRRVRDEIKRPSDLNLDNNDSIKIERHVAVNDPLVKLSTDDAPSIVNEDSSSLKSADCSKKANVIRHSSTSSMNDNVDAPKIDEENANEPISASNEKRDFGFRKGDRAFGKLSRQKKISKKEAKKKTKWQKKKKKKKGGQRIKDISGIGNQRLFKRRLLMVSLEPEYPDVIADHYVVEKRNAENFRKLAGENARRSEKDESRKPDGSEVVPERAQIRGGQDCADRAHPSNIDAAKYLESAHCLRFSNLWYSVYQLEDPIIEHTVYLQVYEKRTLGNGSIYWEDLTRDSVVRLGTFNRHHRGSQDTIAFTYKKVKIPRWREEEKVSNLDIVRDRLLVPSSVTSKDSGYPVKGESNEYLVVPASSINENGNECDKAGVGFAAFAKQPNRCGHISGTCLKNQPLAYRRHDVKARAAGRPGCYFLSNFASVPSEPIKYSASESGSREFLALEYHSPHVSAIDIEVEAGYNAASIDGSMSRISQVNVNSIALDHTVITIVITNTGLIPMVYQSKIVDCPDNLPESWVNATFPKRLVQPRRNQATSLNFYGELPTNEFYCSVQLLNRLGKPVATRRIKIRKMDRCFCTMHCLCVCVSDTRGTDCQPMSLELYHAAGFRGPVPPHHRQIFSDMILDVMFFIVSLILLLLLMGFLKWFMGLCIPAMGRWGLDSIVETSIMSEYFEPELKYKRVVRDEHGAPVHPDTRKKTVRICSRKMEFFLNAMFFLIFPFAICCHYFKRFFRPDRKRYYSNKSKISSTTNKSKRTICVNTYGDNRDSQMEVDDIKYVMDELKKSEESLRNHSRSKVSIEKITKKR